MPIFINVGEAAAGVYRIFARDTDNDAWILFTLTILTQTQIRLRRLVSRISDIDLLAMRPLREDFGPPSSMALSWEDLDLTDV